MVVTADTHLRRDWPNRRLPRAALDVLAGADVILHAGDLCHDGVLDLLGELAPVHAVLGNNDRGMADVLPERLVLELAGVTVAMVHDSGQRRGRAARLHGWFPGADVVVFGHSHVPVDEPGVDGQLLLNPGSPTERRRQPHRTIATLDLEDGRVADRRVHVVAPD